LILKRENKTYQYLFSITLIKGKNDDPSGILLLLRDITRMKEVERLRNDFLMAASHELRTPLTSIGMSIDLLMENVAPKLEEKERDLIYTAREEVLRMKALTSDLLDLSKIESGKITLDLDNVPVRAFFNQVKETFKNQLEMKNISLTSQLPENMPAVEADENKIMWVLSNLVANALRYVPDGNGHIRLSADRVGQYIHLSVSDNGPGIPLEYQSKIFHKFVQVSGQESGGTGLGLAICKEIVRAHRGTIWVDSSPGKGSTFTFTLPVAE
jgi:NtrC-family two-component system sensor histidine kinase KinB